MKITKTTTISPGIYAHVCPLCGQILADACEPDMLPEYSICPCDRNGNKQQTYEVITQDGDRLIRRNKPPRFLARIAFGDRSDLELLEVYDDPSPAELARAMRKAGEYLLKISRE